MDVLVLTLSEGVQGQSLVRLNGQQPLSLQAQEMLLLELLNLEQLLLERQLLCRHLPRESGERMRGLHIILTLTNNYVNTCTNILIHSGLINTHIHTQTGTGRYIPIFLYPLN